MIGGHHHGFADQNGIRPEGSCPGGVLRSPKAAFGNEDRFRRDKGTKGDGCGQVDLKGFQIPVVNPDEGGAGSGSPSDFLGGMGFHQSGKPQAFGSFPEIPDRLKWCR